MNFFNLLHWPKKVEKEAYHTLIHETFDFLHGKYLFEYIKNDDIDNMWYSLVFNKDGISVEVGCEMREQEVIIYFFKETSQYIMSGKSRAPLLTLNQLVKL